MRNLFSFLLARSFTPFRAGFFPRDPVVVAQAWLRGGLLLRWKQRCEDMSSTLEDLKAVIEHTSSENEQLRMFKQHHRAAADMVGGAGT